MHGPRGHLAHLFLFLVHRLADQIFSPNRREIVAGNLARSILALLLNRRADFLDLALNLFYSGIISIKRCGQPGTLSFEFR